MLADEKVREFLKSVCTSSPTPGGGSVAALCGALSASLSAMVCNLTIGKDKYKDVRKEMERVLADSSRLVERLTELIDEDAEAYESVIASLRLPKETDEEKEKRMEAMQSAFRRAIAVPYEVMELSLEAMRLAHTVARKGNEGAVSDSGSGAMMAFAALHAASMNVRINLKEIMDKEFMEDVEGKLRKMEEEADILRSDVIMEVESKL
ncbi:MAG: cyclodeaminase/cyclohydrolase family protein [Methanobacteriota archaeon]|nr:MAG: cyclodeaminase/cyclohydrolase family protein [Euryarchaeota archaeon]